jgi:2-methylisocitrate lyase-like PEP mutase family enzyme
MVCTSLSRPVNVLALSGSPSVELLSAAGVRRISLGTGFIRTAQGAFLRAAREVYDHGTFGGLDGSAVSREITSFMRDA